MGAKLNAFEIGFNKDRITVLRKVYNNDYAALKEYREKYPDYYFVVNYGFIYAWQASPTQVILSEEFKQETIYVDSDVRLFCKIIEESYIRYFRKKNYKIYHLKHSNIWELEVQNSKPESFGDLEIIHCKRFAVQSGINDMTNKPYYYILFTDRSKNRFSKSQDELNNKGIDTRNWRKNRSGRIVGSKDNVTKYLGIIGKSSDFERFIVRQNSPMENYRKLEQTFNGLCNRTGQLYMPDNLEIKKFEWFELPSYNLKFESITKPGMFFYNGKNVTGGYHEEKIKKAKPFTYDMFANKKINILCLTYQEYQGASEIFIDKYVKSMNEYFYIAFGDVDLQIVGRNNEDYSLRLDNIVLENFDLVFIVLSEMDKKMSVRNSAYYRLKAKLLNQKIPSQILISENIRKLNKYTINNIMLNTYAKLGGTAWTIAKNDTVRNELIIGVGSSINEADETAIGFASVFDYDGKYLVGDCSQLSTKANYSANLERHLYKTIEHVIYEKNIKVGQTIKLFFHLFKEAGYDNEIKAILKAMEKFDQYNVQFAVIHLSYAHNYKYYFNKGNGTVSKGYFTKISSDQGLISLGNKSGAPILLKINKNSNFRDLYYIATQVVHFMYLSHSNFMTPPKPVTMLYPGKMAKLANDLTLIDHWDPSVLNQITDKLWFI